jgi:hypothetical protein
LKEHIKSKKWCKDCHEAAEKAHIPYTPKEWVIRCKQCFPGVLSGNEDAFYVYQIASKGSPWGISVRDVLDLCDLYEVVDKASTLEKVLDLSGEVNNDG